MKQQDYILKINNPCKKEWNSMIDNSIGRYCSSCSKSVIDFTQMTDQQIKDEIKKSKIKICGRLTEIQLEKSGKILEPRTNKSILTRFLSGLILLSAAESVNANISQNDEEIIETFQKKQDQLNTVKLNSQVVKTPKDTLRNTIQGQVVDVDTNEPLMFAFVVVKNSNFGVSTDENGNFRLVIPESLISDPIVLVVKYIGYKETEFSINLSDLKDLNRIFVVQSMQEFIGEISIVKKKRWWQFWSKKRVF